MAQHEDAEYRRDRWSILLWLCLALATGTGGLASLLWANVSSQVSATSKEVSEQRIQIRELQLYKDSNREAIERIERYVTALAAKQGVTLPP